MATPEWAQVPCDLCTVRAITFGDGMDSVWELVAGLKVSQFVFDSALGTVDAVHRGPPNVAGFSCEVRAERGLRQLQTVVGRRGMRRQMPPTAKAEATDWSSVRGLPSAPVESTARGAFQSTASRTRRAAEETSAGGEATWRNATALEGHFSEGSLVRTTSTRWMPAGSISPDGTATSYLAAEVQSSPPRRAREGATGTEPAQFKAKRHPGCQLATASTAPDDRAEDAAARTRDQASAARHRDRLISRSRCRLTRPPKPDASGHDLGPRRRSPTRAAADEDPLLSVRPTYQA